MAAEFSKTHPAEEMPDTHVHVSTLEHDSGLTEARLLQLIERTIRIELARADMNHARMTATCEPFGSDRGDYIHRRAYQVICTLKANQILAVAHATEPALAYEYTHALKGITTPAHLNRCRDAVWETACVMAHNEFDARVHYWPGDTMVKVLQRTHERETQDRLDRQRRRSTGAER